MCERLTARGELLSCLVQMEDHPAAMITGQIHCLWDEWVKRGEEEKEGEEGEEKRK